MKITRKMPKSDFLAGSPAQRVVETEKATVVVHRSRFPLCLFFVAQIVPEEQEFYSHGHFVIDTPSNVSGVDENLALLSGADMRKIGEKLGIIANLGCALPVNMRYELSSSAVDPLNLPAAPTFKTEYGHNVWVSREFQIRSL